ncbi:MAG: hypothetical protein J0L59_01690 [Xanthomonadales bacterium]|nr:hypothetical protein [Xanthomonadales bacterium]
MLLAALVFGVGQVSAQTPPGSLVATSVTGLSRGPAGVSGLLNAVLIETERRAYYSVPATVGWGTLGAAAKAGMRGVVRFSPYIGLAMTAADLAGWVRDGDWFNKGDGVPDRELTGPTYWCFEPAQLAIGGTYCSDNAEQLAAWGRSQIIDDTLPPAAVTHAYVQNSRVYLQAKLPNGTITHQVNAGPRTTKPFTYHTPEYREATVVTEQEMAESIANNPANLYTMLHDTSGKPHQYPEIQAALNSLAGTIGQQTGTQPEVEGEEVEPGQEEPGGPEPQPDPTGSELPAFCEWAKVVCDFIDWYKAPPEETTPVKPEWDEDVAEQQEFTPGIADDGSCPAPESVSVWGTDLEFSYQPVCDLAVMLRPVVILGGLILSAFILAGLRNNNV